MLLRRGIFSGSRFSNTISLSLDPVQALTLDISNCSRVQNRHLSDPKRTLPQQYYYSSLSKNCIHTQFHGFRKEQYTSIRLIQIPGQILTSVILMYHLRIHWTRQVKMTHQVTLY